MNRYEFQLEISPEDYLDYYRGTIRHVIVRCRSGQTVQFPASQLQQFVTPEGIHGSFALTCDEQHKCVGLQAVGDSLTPVETGDYKPGDIPLEGGGKDFWA